MVYKLLYTKTAYQDIQNLSEFILEDTESGIIEFKENINLTDDDNPSDGN